MNAPIETPLPSRVWQRMLSGRRLDLIDPSPFDIEIGDIAHGLARLARWNGQTKGPHAFTVAQHCVLAEGIASGLKPGLAAKFRLAALLHDAPEYVVGDLISPFKAVMGSSYKAMAQLIKKADKIAAYYEATQLAGFSVSDAKACFGDPSAWPVTLPAQLVTLEPMGAAAAQAAFLRLFETLEAEARKSSGHAP